MFDVQPIACQLIHTTCFKSFNSTKICPRSIECSRRIYPDIPINSRLIDRKRSKFFLSEKTRPIESTLIEYTNNDSHNHIHHIGSQTIYREESTQTDPFSPVYTISGGEHPEVFTLADFTYGKGLPATSVEISFIERLRARRQWEQDRTIDLTRTKIVIERELREWQLREKEIEMLEAARHKLFTNNLHHYIQIDEGLTQSLIDLSIYRQEKQLTKQHQRMEIKACRDIRRIQRTYRLREKQINTMTSYKHVGVIGITNNDNQCVRILKPPWHTRSEDIITDFKNRFSSMSTRCPTFDNFIDRRMNQAHMNIFQLEKLIPKMSIISPSDHVNSLESNRHKKLRRRIRDLEKASQLIEQNKTKHLSSMEKKPLRFVEKIELIDHIQQLPTTSHQTQGYDQRRLTLIQFQNYLRSVIVQSKIENVYEIRRDLLKELKQGLQSNQCPSYEHVSTEISDDFIDGTIADMLDFLSKELVRLQCEQMIHLFIILAERVRNQREAAETGFRTQTIERQKIEDELLQKNFSLNLNNQIESYLEDLILHSIRKTADDQARLEIQQITERLIQQTNDLLSYSDISTAVADLVHNFLFPTVARLLSKSTKKVK